MASKTRTSLTLPLLERFFSSVTRIDCYLQSILEGNAIALFQPTPNDPASYCDILSTSYVALKQANPLRTKFKHYQVMNDMQEMVYRAQERLFKSKSPRNMITLGYSNPFSGRTGANGSRITNYFVNTLVTALQAPEWEILLQRVGEDAMLHLLSETSIFISLPNDCLCQLTGELMTAMIPSTQLQRRKMASVKIPLLTAKKRPLSFREDDEEQPLKRRKLFHPVSGRSFTTLVKVARHSPSDVTIPRTTMLYARARRVPGTNRIVFGLSEKHILNRIDPSYQRKPKVSPEQYVDPDPREEAEKARHISKYIFPRQYGLSSPFGRIEPVDHVLDYSDREHEIQALGPCKTPKRLKGTLQLLESLIHRHGKCAYKPLLDKICPSKVVTADHKCLDSTVILEMLSEQSIQLQSQASLDAGNVSIDSVGNIIFPYGLTQAEKYIRAKPRFADFVCSSTEVYRYVALITKTVIPKAFWGCKGNLRVMLRHVKTFIECRRYETLTLHYLLQGLSTSECEWLMPPGPLKRQTRVSVSDSIKRRELLEEFVFWYFNSFVISLLKTNFYITESSAFRNKLLYFRQDDWDTLCAPLLKRLETQTFRRLSEVKEILRQRQLGYSFVRLLPKDTGVRPIVNLRRKATNSGSGPQSERSINQILQAAFDVLTFEKRNQSKLLGASVFGHDDVHARLGAFKSRLPRKEGGSLPKLFFVKVDVQACFDTIEQEKLLGILRELISEDAYLIQRHGQVQLSSGRIKRMFLRKSVAADDHPHFLKHATELAAALRSVIFVDQVNYPYAKKEEILHLLEEHITENIVKIGQHYYCQTIGIPQGSSLSSMLCSFFYGHLENRYKHLKDDASSVLMRLIDDYLFITADLAKAREFLEMMKKGHPEYGCFISPDKTLTNFDHDVQIMNVTGPGQRRFPWCGYAIDMCDLSVTVDYSRFFGTDLQNTLTIERGRRPGAAFAHKMLALARTRIHAIYYDRELNTEEVVYLNIYQSFLVLAMKFHAYLRDWKLSFQNNSQYLCGVMQHLIYHTYFAAQNRAVRSGVVMNHADKKTMIWLGTHAFRTVLGKKPARYKTMLSTLDRELCRKCYREHSRRFSNVVRDGWGGVSGILY